MVTLGSLKIAALEAFRVCEARSSKKLTLVVFDGRLIFSSLVKKKLDGKKNSGPIKRNFFNLKIAAAATSRKWAVFYSSCLKAVSLSCETHTHAHTHTHALAARTHTHLLHAHTHTHTLAARTHK